MNKPLAFIGRVTAVGFTDSPNALIIQKTDNNFSEKSELIFSNPADDSIEIRLTPSALILGDEYVTKTCRDGSYEIELQDRPDCLPSWGWLVFIEKEKLGEVFQLEFSARGCQRKMLNRRAKFVW